MNNLLTHNPTGFAVGSILGMDTSNASLSFDVSNLPANVGLTKTGSNALTLSISRQL